LQGGPRGPPFFIGRPVARGKDLHRSNACDSDHGTDPGTHALIAVE